MGHIAMSPPEVPVPCSLFCAIVIKQIHFTIRHCEFDLHDLSVERQNCLGRAGIRGKSLVPSIKNSGRVAPLHFKIPMYAGTSTSPEPPLVSAGPPAYGSSLWLAQSAHLTD